MVERKQSGARKTHFAGRIFRGVPLSSGSRPTRTVGKLLAVLLLIGSLQEEGCRGREPNHRGEDRLVAEIDALGKEVSLREYPRRVVSMAPSNTRTLLALGLRDRIVGVTSFFGSPEEVEGIARIGGYTNPRVDKIVSLRPDIVFAARGNPIDVVQQLRRQRMKVFTLDTRTVSGLLEDIRKVGALTGANERAAHLIAEIKREIHDVREKVSELPEPERPRVLWIGQEHPLRTAGRGSLVDQFIRLAGGTNVAGDEERPWPSYSMEKLVLRDPQVIILSEDTYKGSPDKVAETIARFRRHSVWQNVSAVREGRVHFIPADILGQPSPACVRGLKLLAACLHPDLFADKPENRSGAHGDQS
jgi:iron complex transport system substrate-binding protein